MTNNMIIKLTLLGAALSLAMPWAYADIYKFTDSNGVTHFHNISNFGDPRYKLYKREGKGKSLLRVGRAGQFNTQNRKRFSPIITSVAQRYKVDESLLHAVIMAESGYNPNALSPKGAVGLMQLMPDTAKRYGVVNINDPTQNIHGGTRYIRYLLQLFNNNLQLTLAAYNAGENAVINYGHKIPPYEETVNYVAKVLAFYRNSKVNPTRLAATYPVPATVAQKD
ncbi:MAG TPA: lytic transglycosylase domain-containing protein [Gammaproteobacteria bacterium]|nr:lytic transglycosylase domain-containing protein [Gammaproteobacteria bacterium]